jgi:hypothetical protein
VSRKSFSTNLFIAMFITFFIASSVNADTESFDETYEVNSGTLFEIRNHDGSINIQGWNRNQIKVHATKKTNRGGKLENVDIQVSHGENFKIETIHVVRNPRVSVSYDLRLPMNVVVSLVKTSNGKISLEATYGDTEVKTSNGKIEIKDAVGNINAHTSNGAIMIKAVKGYVSAYTSNGTINVEGVTGVAELETTNGAINTDVSAVGENGLRVRTSNGAIELNLASDLDVDLEVRTSNGKIKFDDLEVVVNEISKNAFSGKIGKGGKKISCRTSNGRIVMKALK